LGCGIDLVYPKENKRIVSESSSAANRKIWRRGCQLPSGPTRCPSKEQAQEEMATMLAERGLTATERTFFGLLSMERPRPIDSCSGKFGAKLI
jgi:hypothetical protein